MLVETNKSQKSYPESQVIAKIFCTTILIVIVTLVGRKHQPSNDRGFKHFLTSFLLNLRYEEGLAYRAKIAGWVLFTWRVDV